MKIIQSEEFDSYWKSPEYQEDNEAVETAVKEIIAAVSRDGDAAVRDFASRFDKSSPTQLEVPPSLVQQSAAELRRSDPELIAAMELAADHIKRFSLQQRAQFSDFEYEMEKGFVTGQRVIPVDRAAAYVPAGRFPLFSSVLMGLIPAFCAGVEEIILASPPLEDGLPDRKILAAAAIAADSFAGDSSFQTKLRVFTVGGAQAIAALALGTQTIPRVDLIVGPGNQVCDRRETHFSWAGWGSISSPAPPMC